jgi:thiosulfate dehydrogenase
MFSDPMMLAQFISWNMPWGAGGLVTDQEAWDLEAYIHAHARPGNPQGKLKSCRE